MNGSNDLDDGWAELARELGLEGDRPFPAPIPDHPAADLHPPEEPTLEVDNDDEFVELPEDAPTDVDGYAELEPDVELEEGEENSLIGDDGEVGEGEGSEEPGEPKKKRRRRRRRKKKPGEAITAETSDGDPIEESDGHSGLAESVDATTDDTFVEEDGATPAATRELIANWDVPSWETIVNTMLFRPQGR